MKQAMELSKNGPIKFFGSTWAAPLWMKTNNKYYGNGFIKKEFYQTWADYFVRFLEEYYKNGVPIWGITTQNEPSMAVLKLKDLPTVGWSSTNMVSRNGDILISTGQNNVVEYMVKRKFRSGYKKIKISKYGNNGIRRPEAIFTLVHQFRQYHR